MAFLPFCRRGCPSTHIDPTHTPGSFFSPLVWEEDAWKGTQRNSRGWMRRKYGRGTTGRAWIKTVERKEKVGERAAGNEGSLAKSNPHRSWHQRTAEGVPTQRWKRRQCFLSTSFLGYNSMNFITSNRMCGVILFGSKSTCAPNRIDPWSRAKVCMCGLETRWRSKGHGSKVKCTI